MILSILILLLTFVLGLLRQSDRAVVVARVLGEELVVQRLVGLMEVFSVEPGEVVHAVAFEGLLDFAEVIALLAFGLALRARLQGTRLEPERLLAALGSEGVGLELDRRGVVAGLDG